MIIIIIITEPAQLTRERDPVTKARALCNSAVYFDTVH